MNKLRKSIIKIKFINNPKFMELSDDKKDLFYNKYHLVYNNIPVIDSLSLKNRRNINNGLLDSVNNNTSSYLNNFYMDYINRVLETPTGKVCKNVLYNDFFNKHEKEELLNRIYLFVKYSYSGVHIRFLKEENDQYFYNLLLNIKDRFNYRELPSKTYKEFYEEILFHIVAYFTMHDELISNMDYFNQICNFFEDNIEMLFIHYTTNYNDKYRYIPEDLINKYNNGLVKKMII